MFQRIQSLYLFIALGLVASTLFGLPLIMFEADQTAVTVNVFSAESTHKIFGGQSKLYFVLAGGLALLLVFCLFSFSNRKIQRFFSWFSLLLAFGTSCTVYLLEYVSVLNCTQCTVSNPMPAIGFWLIVLAIPFLLLAIRGINKDQDLVDSLDRLR
jgi:hypothetical protein